MKAGRPRKGINMRLGFTSDTHGDTTGWKKVVSALGEVDLLFHSGDVLYHGAFNPILDSYSPRDLVEMLNSTKYAMLHAKGNCDSEVDQIALDNHILSDFAFSSVEGIRILVNHGHRYDEDELVKMAKRADAVIIHRGHTHIPEIRVIDGIVLLNPGSPSLPKQDPEVPTAALLENGVISILDVNTGEKIIEQGLP